jgi:hypothetical protein
LANRNAEPKSAVLATAVPVTNWHFNLNRLAEAAYFGPDVVGYGGSLRSSPYRLEV